MVVGECRINLGERQVGVLPLNLFRIPVMSQSIEGNFNDLGTRAFDERRAVGGKLDVGIGDRCHRTGPRRGTHQSDSRPNLTLSQQRARRRCAMTDRPLLDRLGKAPGQQASPPPGTPPANHATA